MYNDKGEKKVLNLVNKEQLVFDTYVEGALEEYYSLREKDAIIDKAIQDSANKVIEGVGKDAEIVTNSNGGKQSKSPAALYLLDPEYLLHYFDNSDKDTHAGMYIVQYMMTQCKDNLFFALDELEPDSHKQLMAIGKVLQEGAEKYSPNNWRLIPREQHLNHALVHIVALLAGDEQDDHKDHAMCRLHMAIATKETKGFSYTEPFNNEA